MNKKFRALHPALLAVSAFLFFSGCSASTPSITYYSLLDPSPRQSIVGGNDRLAVSVGPVTVPDVLRQTRIATGGKNGRYQLSEFHRWAGEVDRDLARAVAERLAIGLETEQVAIFPSGQHFQPTCRVLLDVLFMGGELGREATLIVRWTVADPQGETPQRIRRSDLRETPVDGSHTAWVAAQQRNIGKLGGEIVAELQKRL